MLGLALGLIMQALVIAVQNAVDYRHPGTTTSSATFFRSIAGSFGTAVFGAIFSNALVSHLAWQCFPDEKVRCALELRLSLPTFFFCTRQTRFFFPENFCFSKYIQAMFLALELITEQKLCPKSSVIVLSDVSNCSFVDDKDSWMGTA
ncbi:MAG TPA: hypothetical protein VF043_01960 [Ktedonobacteraceae bacterium]